MFLNSSLRPIVSGLCSRCIKNVSKRRISLSTCVIDTKYLTNETFLKVIEGKTSKHVFDRIQIYTESMKQLQELKRQSSSIDILQDIEMEEKTIHKQMESLGMEIIEDLTKDGDESIKTVLLEVKAGIGGQEAMLFAKDMFLIYNKLCSDYNWTSEVIKESITEIGGLSEVSIQIEGQSCYKLLRHEAGVHRVQRVPKTEKSGRIHTSTITVTVIPIRELVKDNDIPMKDLKVTNIRSGGPGGQHVNKTESCVCIKHLPTGITVECQEGRHQIENKIKAMNKLKQLLWLKDKERLMAEYESTKDLQVSSPDRSEKIRTYNFLQDRITDHRISENMSNIREFMTGSDGIKLLIQSLEQHHKNRIVEKLLSNFK